MIFCKLLYAAVETKYLVNNLFNSIRLYNLNNNYSIIYQLAIYMGFTPPAQPNLSRQSAIMPLLIYLLYIGQ